MDNNQSISFSDLGQKYNIRIPAIQRDYAQGRKTPNITKIRKKFVHSLALVVKGVRQNVMLDFVYGSERNDAFEPLDGQQRLTTLFLFHWILGTELFDKNKHSRFTYETRISTFDFCNMLVNVVAKDLIVEVMSTNKRIDEIRRQLDTENDERLEMELKELTNDGKVKKFVPSVIIQSWSDFKYEWRFDPSIQSMLVMIDSIFEEMDFHVIEENGAKQEVINWSKYSSNLNHITFDILNIEDFGFSDELFVKMNARGKQLSDFDIAKSSIESEIQLLQRELSEYGEPLASKKDEVEWRTYMDGKWIDLFWNRFAVKEFNVSLPDEREEDITKRHFKAAENAENKFKFFILRMIGLQLLINNSEDKVLEAAYNTGADAIDDLLDTYQDSLVELRSQEKTEGIMIGKSRVIDFANLISSINSIVYKDPEDGRIKEITHLLPQTANADPEKRAYTYFDLFTNDKVTNFNTVVMYAICSFCKKYKYAITEKTDCYDKQSNKAWLSNLTEWVKFIRNLVLFDNVNDRIDTRSDEIDALKSVDKLLVSFDDFCKESGKVDSNPNLMIQFIALDPNRTTKGLPGLDNSAIEEEIEKAKLKLNGNEWVEWIAKAEEHSYLWGQIRCLLSWSQSDINKFIEYWNCLQEVLDTSEKNWQKIYVWLLKHSDYWENSNMLYEYNNKDRDLSFKRYFRTKREGMFYASAIKDFLDEWKTEGCELNEFLDNEMNAIRNGEKDWIWCMANYPEIINWSNRKKIFQSKGHYLLSKGKTMNTHCNDPVLLYLMQLHNSEKGNERQLKYGDSQDKDEARQNTVEFVDKDGNAVLVGWGENDGCYKVTGSVAEEYSTNDMLDKVVPIIKEK